MVWFLNIEDVANRCKIRYRGLIFGLLLKRTAKFTYGGYLISDGVQMR
jgi:hypothetical protein